MFIILFVFHSILKLEQGGNQQGKVEAALSQYFLWYDKLRTTNL